MLRLRLPRPRAGPLRSGLRRHPNHTVLPGLGGLECPADNAWQSIPGGVKPTFAMDGGHMPARRCVGPKQTRKDLGSLAKLFVAA